MINETDIKMMQLALAKAKKAWDMGEVPIGAVVVDSAGNILASACNQTITSNDPTSHAEILALRAACQNLSNYRLPPGATLYATIEPCIMCMGALIHARVSRVVFGATDPKWGGGGSVCDLARNLKLNHQIKLYGGLMADECKALMQDFFKDKRAK